MGTRSNLYAGQPETGGTTAVTSPANTATTITYAWARNTGSSVETLNVFMGGIEIMQNFVLEGLEERPIFGLIGGTLNTGQAITLVSSTDATINVRIDGYQVSTA